MQVNDWTFVASYLFADKKLTNGKANVGALKSRYVIIAREFSDKNFNRENFNKFIYERKSAGYKATSLNNLIKMAKHIAGYYKIKGFEDITYYKEIRADHEYISPALIKSMAEVEIPYGKFRTETNKKYKALIYFMGLSGGRISECLGLLRKDFGLGPDGYYAIFRDTKNGDTRRIPVPDIVAKFIDDLPKTSEFVFTTYRGNKLDEATVNLELKRRALAVGHKGRIHCHLFRYSLITTLIKSGVGISYVARIAGHRDIKSTDRYTLLEMSELREALNNHPLLKESLELETITVLTKKFLEKLIDKSRYSLGVIDGGNELSVHIVKIG